MQKKDTFLTQDKCDRCGKPLNGARKMSWFTEETLCITGEKNCIAIEQSIRQKLRDKGDFISYEGCGYIPRV